MTEKLRLFLSGLAVDPKKLAAYQKDPDTAMQEADLVDEDRATLKSGDASRVEAALTGRVGQKKSQIWAGIQFLSELAVDHKKLAAFHRDPDAAMQEAGLDDADRAILKSGNASRVRAALKGSVGHTEPPQIWGGRGAKTKSPAKPGGGGAGRKAPPQVRAKKSKAPKADPN